MPSNLIRTGIFGGSFNPIHNGHLALAKRLLSVGAVDEVWFVVSPLNPLKRQADLLDDAFRLQMVNLAVAGESRMRASDFEFSLPRPSYMWHTLSAMSCRWPERDFRLIIGADNWLCFNRWFAHKDIINNYRIIIYPRPGSPVDTASLPSTVSLIDMPMTAVSSTMIRQFVSRGQPVDRLVPSAVAEFICSHKLYLKPSH